MGRPAQAQKPKIGVQTAAFMAGTFLAGAMLSLSAISIPVLLDTNTDPAHSVRQWARLYYYGHIELPFLCITTTLLYVYAALSKQSMTDGQWLVYAVAGLATITMVPFTWVFMAKTNDQLFCLNDLSSRSSGDIDPGVVGGLLVRWAFLHVVRSAFPLLGAGLGVAGVAKELGIL